MSNIVKIIKRQGIPVQGFDNLLSRSGLVRGLFWLILKFFAYLFNNSMAGNSSTCEASAIIEWWERKFTGMETFLAMCVFKGAEAFLELEILEAWRKQWILEAPVFAAARYTPDGPL